MLPAGLEPTITRPKRVVISISPRERHTNTPINITTKLDFFLILSYHHFHCGYGLVVERVLAKDEIRVRFPVAAPECSTAAVYTLRVRETRVRFSALRHRDIWAEMSTPARSFETNNNASMITVSHSGLSYSGSICALGAYGLGSIPSSPTSCHCSFSEGAKYN